MKILYIHDENINSEKANIVQVLQMCKAFSELGCKVTLALPKDGYSEKDIKEVVCKKLNKEIDISIKLFPRLAFEKGGRMVGGLYGVWKLVGRFDSDVCFVRNPAFLSPLISKNIPTIFESHSFLLHEKHSILDRLWKRNLLFNSRSKYFLKFITISNCLSEKWISFGIPSHKIIPLHDGVDVDNYPTSYDCDSLRRKLQLPLHKKIILYAGRIHPDRAIDNIMKLAGSFSEESFLVLGGPEENVLHYRNMSIALRLKNINFLGHIEHFKVNEYLLASDVLLMTWTNKVKTIDYCSPLKMFEYMAAGKIIVGYGFPTIKEVLSDGENAFLADPGSFEDLESKLALALSQSDPSRMAQAARNLAVEKYTWKSRAKNILDSLDRFP